MSINRKQIKAIQYRIPVGKNSVTFDTIQEAIDSITVLANERYVVEVYPGIYNENVVLKDGVSLFGVGSNEVIITSSVGTTLTFTGSNVTSHIQNVTIRSEASLNTQHCIEYTTGLFFTHNVIIDFNLTGTYGEAIIFSGAGICVLHNGVMIDIDQTGLQGGTIKGIEKTGSGDLYVTSSSLFINTTGLLATDNIIILDDQTVTTGMGEFHIADTSLHVTSTASSLGDITFLNSTNNGSAKTHIKNNQVIINGNGVGTVFLYTLTTVGTREILTTTNSFDVTTFTNEYFCNIASGNILDSRFEILHYTNIDRVDDICFGLGEINFVTSPDDGDIQLSGIVVPIFIEQIVDYVATENWKFDIMMCNSSSQLDLTFPLDISNFKDGKKWFIHNIGSELVLIDPNGNNIDNDPSDRQIRPNGYVELEKIDGDLKVIREKNYSSTAIASDFSNLEIWLDFSDSSTITATGSLVDSVDSKDGNLPLRTCTATGTGRPNILADYLNGKDVLKFDGNDRFTFGDLEVHSNVRGLHVIAVCNPFALNDIVVGKYSTSGANREWYMQTSRSRCYDTGTGTYQSANFNLALNQWQIMEMTWTPSGSVRSYLNSYLKNTSSGVIVDIDDTISELMVGDVQNGGNFLGEMVEIIIYSDVLGIADRLSILNGLAGKYNIDNIPILNSNDYWDRNDTTNTITPDNKGDILDMETGALVTNRFYQNVRNESGASLTTGIVKIEGYNATEDLILITAITTTSDSCIGLLESTLNNNVSDKILTTGLYTSALDTTSATINDPVYFDAVGNLTLSSGSSQIGYVLTINLTGVIFLKI